MKSAHGSVAHLVLIILWIFVSLQRSQALSWSQRPENPTFFLEGVNNTGPQKLEWRYLKESNERVEIVTFYRKKGDDRVELARNTNEGPFRVFPNYVSNYDADLQSTLILKNAVTNDEEDIYSVEVVYAKNNIPQPRLTDEVRVIVYVPPTIFKEPKRESEVGIGQNLTLVCNASGDPLPNVTWTKEGENQRQFNASGSVLYLVDVKRENVGSYKCTATNKVGDASSLAIVTIACPANRCFELEFGITLTDITWKQAFKNEKAVEYKMLKTNLSSEIARIYTLAQNVEKNLYDITITEFRQGSTIAVVRLRFENNVTDPLKPLRDAITDGKLGGFKVARQLLNTTITPTTNSTQEPPSSSTSSAPQEGLSSAEIGIIVGGSVGFVVVLIIVALVVFFYCQRKDYLKGRKKRLSEADGYRMNRQPSSSGLGTASPAYVEARMFAPPNTGNKKDKSEKRPLPDGKGGAQDGQGGFELWC